MLLLLSMQFLALTGALEEGILSVHASVRAGHYAPKYRVIYLILLPETGCCEPILTPLKV